MIRRTGPARTRTRGRRTRASSPAPCWFFSAALALFVADISPLDAREPTFQRIHGLKPDEGVFAYSRISPDGRTLAYTSEMPDPDKGGEISQTVTVVDLQNGAILFQEPGVDAYWSNDGSRMIYLSHRGRNVTIRHHDSGLLSRDVIQDGLGDYFSWGVRDGKDLIITIQGNYYYLDGDKAVLPRSTVNPCPDIGTGQRPFLSHDGRRISVFVRGTVVIRNLTDCEDIFDTGIDGAKADFSFDGRYLTMHRAKRASAKPSYDIVVVDLRRKTIRVVTEKLSGSGTFPSWTRDGRINFRYEGTDFRGFMLASDVLSSRARPLPAAKGHLTDNRTWSDIFPASVRPPHWLNLVMIWGTWSAHSPRALVDLQRAGEILESRAFNVSIATALEPGTLRSDADRIRQQNHIRLPELPLGADGFSRTEARNQIPTTLLFRDGKLIDRHLGPLTSDALIDWITDFQDAGP